LKVEAVSDLAPDASQAYVIDPASLQTLTSIGRFDATWQDGSLMLSSVNVTAEDHSAAVVGNVITAVTKLLPIAMGVPAPGALHTESTSACTPNAETALTNVQTLKPELDDVTAQVEASTAQLARLTARAATMGTAVDEATKTALAAEIDNLATLRHRQDDLSQQLSSALERITSVTRVRWPEDSLALSGGPYSLGSDAVRHWFSSAPTQIDSVYLRLERVGSFGRDTQSQLQLPQQRVTSGIGIRYRIPGIGRLVACSATPCASSDRDHVLTEVRGQVAQLGYVALLPVRNRTFGSTSFEAEFTAAGGLHKMGYEQRAAPAEVATGAIAAGAGQIAGVLDPTARLQRDTAYLQAEQARRVAEQALQPVSATAAERATLEADTTLLQARAANLQAQIALDQLRAHGSN
jgi:hypothetical protein